MFSKKIYNDARGVIALLFRRIILNNNLLLVIDSLINKYVDKQFKETYDRTAEKTNILTAVKGGKMSLSKFIELFKKLFNIKYMSFIVVTNYKDTEYTSEVILDLKKDNDDVVYLLFQGLLKSGLNKYLKENIDTLVVKNNLLKIKYTTTGKIKNKKMTWKTLVELLDEVYNVKNIKITCKLEFGKTMIEESSSIRLKGEDDVITNN
jgi:hypothetical protein